MEVFRRLKSIQFDPIAPVGCNHDLVLQARFSGYKVGAWEKLAYQDRLIYDGWDKMASLVPYEGWPLRRIIYKIVYKNFADRIFGEHKEAVEAVLKELQERGPMMPKDFEFQQRNEEWKGHWFGPSVTKQTLRALWHTGQIMTAGRKRGQHVYDLTERVVPPQFLNEPAVDDWEAKRQLTLERHQTMGILRPSAAAEVWSYQILYYDKKKLVDELLQMGNIVPVEVEGMKANADPEFLKLLDQPSIEPRVVFIAPLDQFMWDRKMISHLFGFDYTWEIYTPLAKRRWGYYVLPVLYGDELVARVEFWCRNGILEIREWHEERELGPEFWNAFEEALRQFMRYCSAKKGTAVKKIDRNLREMAKRMRV